MAIDTRSISNLMHVDMQENSIQARTEEWEEEEERIFTMRSSSSLSKIPFWHHRRLASFTKRITAVNSARVGCSFPWNGHQVVASYRRAMRSDARGRKEPKGCPRDTSA
jgi:hypothetical protein